MHVIVHAAIYEQNTAKAYDTGSILVVGSNKAGSIQAACSIDVQPLDDLRSNLKCVGDFTTDVSLRAMRANRKAESEKQNDVYEASFQIVL